MTIETLTYVAYTQTVLSTIVSFFAFIKFRSREVYIRLIGLTFLLGVLASTVSFTVIHTGLKGAKPVLNIIASVYDLMEQCIISLTFYYALNKRYGKLFLSVSIFFLIFAISNLLWFQKQEISSYNKFLSSFIIINYCIFYFYRLMVELPSTHLQRMPMFWFNSAFLIYYAGALILFIFTSYITKVLKNNLISYWVFHNSLNICEHLIILVGLYFDLKKNNKDNFVDSSRYNFND